MNITKSHLSTSINIILLDAQISEYNKNSITTRKACDISQINKNSTPTAPQLQSFQNNHPLSLVPRNFKI